MVGGFGLSSWAASGGDQVSGYFSFIDFFFFLFWILSKYLFVFILNFVAGFVDLVFFSFFFFSLCLGFFGILD